MSTTNVEGYSRSTYSMDELLENKRSPLPLEVIPNKMGINLCSVKSISWLHQDDGQLVDLTINFIPALKGGRE